MRPGLALKVVYVRDMPRAMWHLCTLS